MFIIRFAIVCSVQPFRKFFYCCFDSPSIFSSSIAAFKDCNYILLHIVVRRACFSPSGGREFEQTEKDQRSLFWAAFLKLQESGSGVVCFVSKR